MKKNSLKPADRELLHLKVANVIRKAIFDGSLKPGERLIQEDLAEVLGVSRMPVREAIYKLEMEGLIKVTSNGGAIVKSLNVEDIEEIYKIRATLEKMAVFKSIKGLQPEDVLELEKLVKKMEKTTKPEVFVQANIEFHKLLIKYCPWDRLLSFIETLWNGFPQQTPTIIQNQISNSNKEHIEILNAVRAKDPVLASVLIEEHITRTGDAIVQSLREKGSISGKE